MSYEELKKLYPNKEIKLISENFKQIYLNFGFKVIDSFKQDKETYYFMIEWYNKNHVLSTGKMYYNKNIKIEGGYKMIEFSSNSGFIPNTPISKEWTRVSFTFKWKGGTYNGTELVPHIYPRPDYSGTYVSRVKLEKGNKATDWTPAPEDVQESIDETNALATSARDIATTAEQMAAEGNTKIDELSATDFILREGYYQDLIYTIQEDVENANIEIGPIKTTTESVDTHFTFGEAGLTIGRDNLKNKLNLTNERISFISDGSHDSTYITENTFYSHNIVVRDALTMINHTITNYQDKTVFRYVGK